MKSHLVLFVIMKSLIEDKLGEYTNDLKNSEDGGYNGSERVKYEKMMEMVSDIFKITLPLCFQNIIAEDVATAKLSSTILNLMKNEEIEFIKFMYVFLYADIGAKDSLDIAMDFMRNTKSKDLEKIAFFKMIYYFSIDFFPKRRIDLKRFLAESIMKNQKSKRRGNLEINNYARSEIEKSLDALVRE